jgi:hypothetical protein
LAIFWADSKEFNSVLCFFTDSFFVSTIEYKSVEAAYSNWAIFHILLSF